MTEQHFKFIGTLILTSFISAEVLITFAKEYESLNIPYWLYIASIYIRATSSIGFLFLGLYPVISSKRPDYSLIGIGFLASILSVGPPITALYFSKDIDISYLSETDLQSLTAAIRLQKSFLIFFVTVLIASTVAFWVAIKRRNITK
jgi:hypothetical protein